jgi:hypothetical protein
MNWNSAIASALNFAWPPVPMSAETRVNGRFALVSIYAASPADHRRPFDKP